MSEFDGADYRDESASELVKRTFKETKSPSMIEKVVAFLSALNQHVARERLTSEILHEWYRTIYGGDYATDLASQASKKTFLDDIMWRWYYHHWAPWRKAEPLSKKKYITEIAKWFWLRHRVRSPHEDHGRHERSQRIRA